MSLRRLEKALEKLEEEAGLEAEAGEIFVWPEWKRKVGGKYFTMRGTGKQAEAGHKDAHPKAQSEAPQEDEDGGNGG